MKIKLIYIVTFLLLSGSLSAQHFTPNAYDHETNMPIVAQVTIEGELPSLNTVELGAYIDGTIRGSATIQSGLNNTYWMQVFFDEAESNMPITFALWDGNAEYTSSLTTVTPIQEGQGSKDHPLVIDFSLTKEQTLDLVAGWNWWSSSIELSAIDGLSILEDALGDNGIIIKASNQFVQNMDWSEGWMGSLAALTNERCYKIQTSAECAVTMRGPVAHPADHPITIQPEWNWIGYPVAHAQNVASALEGFQPSANDIIKGQNGYATYIQGLGWLPEFTLEPGKGYLYHSNNENTQTLVYSINRGVVPEDTDDALFWHGNAHAYADNLCLLAVVSIDGEEQRTENLELGAFVEDECRGSARLLYVEPFDRYFAIMTVSGEDGDEVYFKLKDRSDQSVRRSGSSPVVFANNAVVGTFDEPFVADFTGHASSEENEASLALYPNPVGRGESFRLLVPENEVVVEWTVSDAVGAAVRHKTGAFDSNTIEGLPVSGIYLVKVVCKSGNTYHHRLIVK